MKELSLKYGCKTNQKPARIYMEQGELPIEVLGDDLDTSIFLMHLMVGNLFANLKLQQAFLLPLRSNTFRQLVLQSEYL